MNHLGESKGRDISGLGKGKGCASSSEGQGRGREMGQGVQFAYGETQEGREGMGFAKLSGLNLHDGAHEHVDVEGHLVGHGGGVRGEARGDVPRLGEVKEADLLAQQGLHESAADAHVEARAAQSEHAPPERSEHRAQHRRHLPARNHAATNAAISALIGRGAT